MKNIAFSKRLLLSIAKPSKYDEMIKLGLKKAIKYFIGLIVIMALILSLVGTYIQSVELQKIGTYVDENVPEFKIENTAKEGEDVDYKLTLDNNEVIILDNQEFLNTFSNIIVVNINMKEEDAIQEYYKLATDNNICTVFLKDKCIMISSKYNPENENQEDGITKYTYLELRDKYVGTEITEFNKDNLMVIFNNASYSYYIIAYFVNYFVILLVIFALDVIVLAIAAKVMAKIVKKDINIKRIFSLSIYSSTLPIILYIVYLIINYFAKLNIGYINIINMMIALIYVMLYFIVNRNNDTENK